MPIREWNAEEAIAFAVHIKVGHDREIAHELFMWLMSSSQGESLIGKATDEQLLGLLDKLAELDVLDDHWIKEFLEVVSERQPEAVIDFFLCQSGGRRSTGDDFDDETVSPLPTGVAAMARSERFPQLLRKVFDRVVWGNEDDSEAAARLYRLMSKRLAAVPSADILMEALDATDPVFIKAVGEILRGCSWATLHAQKVLTIKALEAAHSLGRAQFETMRSILIGAATTGSKTTTWGEPFPADVAMRDQAKEIADSIASDSLIRRFFDEITRHAAAAIFRSKQEYDRETGE